MNFDQQLFHLLNGGLTHPWLDYAMPIITDQKNWLPFLAAIWFWLLLGRNGAHRRLAVLLVLIVIGADQMSSAVIKPLIRRARPCCAEPNARLLIPCKTSKSFPSSHAANTAGVAGVVWLEAGWRAGLPVWVIAVMVGYSRIYVGVHYPADVLCGHLLGLLLGACLIFLANRLWAKKINSPLSQDKTIVATDSHSQHTGTDQSSDSSGSD
ncbi:MAG TPA: phosphatase PAP2 family protein [Candidatus Ozemobacteraceae bacterium]|nr:phosphatase PAP2 family protein [Candidatus Ozemobacteraceae bacterium]